MSKPYMSVFHRDRMMNAPLNVVRRVSWRIISGMSGAPEYAMISLAYLLLMLCKHYDFQAWEVLQAAERALKQAHRSDEHGHQRALEGYIGASMDQDFASPTEDLIQWS